MDSIHVFLWIFYVMSVTCKGYQMNFIVIDDNPTCFRRLAPGRRLMEKYIRKTLKCESLRQCEEDCAQEWAFQCEGFSFRFDPRGSICQLTPVPSDRLMIVKDFNADRDWDYFERDKDAPKNCYRPMSGLRPWNQYGQPPPGPTWHRNDKPPPPLPPHHHPPAHRPQHWGFSSGDYGAKPDYNYGGGNSYFGYKDTYATGEGFPNSLQPVPPPAVQSPPTSSNECFIRKKVGFRLDRNVVVLSLAAPSLYHCELECANEKKFLCNVFSFRYAQSTNSAGDNCHLGERAFHTLDFYTDILPDRDYDLYIRNEKGPPVCVPRRSSESDCFERVRSGLRLHNSMTKMNAMTNSISECEKACIHSKMFTCRAFSYRYGSPTIGQERENCQLTDFPIAELNPAKHFIEDPNCELYHRGSYGHGCELDKWNFNQPAPPQPQPPPPVYGPPPTASGSSYYGPPHKQGYHPPNGYGYGSSYKPTNYPYKPHGYLPPNQYYPPSTYGPVTVGTPSGNNGYGYPEYPSYNPPPTNSIQNTYISPANIPPPTAPPPPQPSYLPSTGVGPTQGTGYLPPSSYGGSSYGGSSYGGSSYGGSSHGGTGYGFTSIGGSGYDASSKDKMCYLGYGSPARLTPSAIRSSLLVRNELECKAQCSQARESSHFRCASLSFRSNNCELSDIEQRDLRPGIDFNHEPGYWLFSWDFTDAKCYTPPRGNVPVPSGPNTFMNGGMEGTWQRFTVSGQPCKAGTVCTENRDVGVWSCPVEGLNGDWDYCCRSNHKCGYSEGYNYPWYACAIHFTTWESAVYGLYHSDELRPLREKLYPTRVPFFKPKVTDRALLHNSTVVDKWCLPFPGPDRSIANRTQRYLYDVEKQRPIQIRTYIVFKSLFNALCMAIFAVIFGFMVKMSITRRLLLNFPRIFSGGMVSHKGPTEETRANTLFQMTFFGQGWNEQVGLQDAIKLPKTVLKTKLSGYDPGYGFTANALILSAVCVLRESDKLPPKYRQHREGIKYSMDAKGTAPAFAWIDWRNRDITNQSSNTKFMNRWSIYARHSVS